MILTNFQCTRAQARILVLKGRQDLLSRRIANPKEQLLAQAELMRIEQRIAELREQIRRYYDLQHQRARPFQLQTLSELPQQLIERRIALRLSQSRFAKLANIHPRLFHRYEKTHFHSVSLARLLQLDAVLTELENSHFGKNKTNTAY